jgi:hypothetical protein
MRYKQITTALVICLSIFQISFAQENSTEVVDQSLDQRFNSLVENSETFNEYKVIKKTTLNEFWKVVSDSVALSEESRKSGLSTIKIKQRQIEDLNLIVANKDKELASGEEEKSNISVLSGDFNKSTYAIVSVIIPLVLLLVIGIVIVKMKSDNSKTVASQKELSSLTAEFETHKKSALEIQMKLKRELQTEWNKLAELSKKP